MIHYDMIQHNIASAPKGGSSAADGTAHLFGFQRVRLKHNLMFRGWNSHAHREFQTKSESRNLSRDNLRREIGRNCAHNPTKREHGALERTLTE